MTATPNPTETRRSIQIRLQGFHSESEVCSTLAGLFGTKPASYAGSITLEKASDGSPVFLVDRDVCEGGNPDWGPKDCAAGAACGPLTK